MILMVAALLALAAPSPSPAPSPCATTAPSIAGATPAPCPSNGPKEIGRVNTTVGRSANLVGTATAASEGTINQEQIANRPILRPGEVLVAQSIFPRDIIRK